MPTYGFLLTRFLPYYDEQILSLHGRIRVSENPHSRIFYAVMITSNCYFNEFIVDFEHASFRYRLHTLPIFV